MANESISFIPKTAVPKPVYGERSFGFLVSITFVALIVSVSVLAGAYLYGGLLDSDIAKSNAEMDKVKKEFEINSIRSFSDMAATIDLAKTVIGSHVALSQLLAFLQENTLNSTRFNNFDFSGNDKTTLILGGETTSFTSLAEQAHTFSSGRYVRSITLSDLSLRPTGNIGFNMAITFDPLLIISAPIAQQI